MKIYLDSKDLINLLNNSGPIGVDDFEKALRSNGHELILSSSNVFEISAPLIKKAHTNVMRLLNRLERLPIRFIHNANIPKLELLEAIDAFNNIRTYQKIMPFVPRFDYTLSIDGPPPTRDYINHSISETIFTLWREDPELFLGFPKHTIKLRHSFELDRAMIKRPSLKDNFTKTIGLSLQNYEISFPLEKLKQLADWIYNNPIICPSIRLNYNIFHKIVKNIGDIPKESDINDFTHIDCIPYVDMVTIDNRMYNYIAQVRKGIDIKIGVSLYNNYIAIYDHIIRSCSTTTGQTA